MPPSSQDFYICPGCGAEILVGSSGCSHCTPKVPRRRSKERATDDDFDYEAFLQEEFGTPIKPRYLAWHWWVTGVVLLACLLWQIFGR
jgi:hypothetical protein